MIIVSLQSPLSPAAAPHRPARPALPRSAAASERQPGQTLQKLSPYAGPAPRPLAAAGSTAHAGTAARSPAPRGCRSAGGGGERRLLLAARPALHPRAPHASRLPPGNPLPLSRLSPRSCQESGAFPCINDISFWASPGDCGYCSSACVSGPGGCSLCPLNSQALGAQGTQKNVALP